MRIRTASGAVPRVTPRAPFCLCKLKKGELFLMIIFGMSKCLSCFHAGRCLLECMWSICTLLLKCANDSVRQCCVSIMLFM